MKISKIIQAVFAAFIGIQKKTNLDIDDKIIEKNGFIPYLVISIVFAFIFIISIITVVSIVLD